MNFYQAFELNKTKEVVGPNRVVWPIGMMNQAAPDHRWRHDHVFGQWREVRDCIHEPDPSHPDLAICEVTCKYCGVELVAEWKAK